MCHEEKRKAYKWKHNHERDQVGRFILLDGFSFFKKDVKTGEYKDASKSSTK